MGNETLCRDFCLVTDDGKFMVLGSWAPPRPHSPTPDERANGERGAAAADGAGDADANVNGTATADSQSTRLRRTAVEEDDDTTPAIRTVMALETITLHLVDARTGRVCDRYTMNDDFVLLESHQGVDLLDNVLMIMSIRFQEVRFLQIIARDAKFRKLYSVGKFCRDDDRMLLHEQAERDRRFRLASNISSSNRAALANGGAKSSRDDAAGAEDGNGSDEDGDLVSGSDYFFVVSGAAAASAAGGGHNREAAAGGALTTAAARAQSVAAATRTTHSPLIGAGLGGGMSSRGFYDGLMHKLLLYLYRRHELSGTQSRFFQHVRQYTKLILLKAQMLDHTHLLLRIGDVEVTQRSVDNASALYFLVVFNTAHAKIVRVYENRSEELLRLYHSHMEWFHRDARFTPPRKELESAIQALESAATPAARSACAGRVRSVLSALPASPQIKARSVYLDRTLFSFDERRAPALDGVRPLVLQEYPAVKFVSRRTGALRFKLTPGARSPAAVPDGTSPLAQAAMQRVRKTAVFLFNPVLPFVISIQHGPAAATSTDATTINFHLRAAF